MCPRRSLPCVVSLYRDPRSFHQEGISAQCTRGTIHEPAQSLNRCWQVWFWQVWRSLVKIDHETSELNPSLCDDDTIFCQMTPQSIYQLRALADKYILCPKDYACCLLRSAFYRYIAHRWTQCSASNRLCIVFLTLHKRGDANRQDKTRFMI